MVFLGWLPHPGEYPFPKYKAPRAPKGGAKHARGWAQDPLTPHWRHFEILVAQFPKVTIHPPLPPEYFLHLWGDFVQSNPSEIIHKV